MASTNKTEKLGLNLWSETDRPQRNDFNSDNNILDSVLGGHTADNEVHLTSEEKARVHSPMAVFSYIGNGEEYKDLSIPFDARAVFAYRASNPMNCYDSTQGMNLVNGGFSFYGGDGTQGVRLISPNSLRVFQGENQETKMKLCLNENGVQYKFVAFR